jgi:hypothetical protein
MEAGSDSFPISNIYFMQMKARGITVLCQVLDSHRGKVAQGGDLVTVFQQTVNQMTANKSCASGDQTLHTVSPLVRQAMLDTWLLYFYLVGLNLF